MLELKVNSEIPKKKMKLSETAVLIVDFLLVILQKLPSVDFRCCFWQDD